MFLIPFCTTKVLNSRDVIGGPLSLTTYSGIAADASKSLNLSTVAKLDVDFIRITSFEKLSFTIKNDRPFNSPKSMCALYIGLVVHRLNCNGATDGLLLSKEHTEHDFTVSSMSESIFGHHIKLLAGAFIQHIRICPSCISSINLFRSCSCTITLIPNNMMPYSIVS